MAHRRCAHFIAVVCLNAPSMFGQKMHPCTSQYNNCRQYMDGPYRKLTDRCASPYELTPSAQPLAFRNEGHAITLLMHSQVTAVAKDNGIGVLAIAVIANGTLGVLFLSLSYRLAIDSGCTARSRPMRLRRLGVRFRYALCKLAGAIPTWLNLGLTYASPKHATPSQSE